jgi:hypothetical protein
MRADLVVMRPFHSSCAEWGDTCFYSFFSEVPFHTPVTIVAFGYSSGSSTRKTTVFSFSLRVLTNHAISVLNYGQLSGNTTTTQEVPTASCYFKFGLHSAICCLFLLYRIFKRCFSFFFFILYVVFIWERIGLERAHIAISEGYFCLFFKLSMFLGISSSRKVWRRG